MRPKHDPTVGALRGLITSSTTEQLDVNRVQSGNMTNDSQRERERERERELLLVGCANRRGANPNQKPHYEGL